MVDDDEIAAIVHASQGVAVRSVERQTLAHSGSTVARVVLGDARTVVARVSPRPQAFDDTGRHLDTLRALGLPVQTLLTGGATPRGGSFVILNWLPGRDLLYELPQMSAAQAAALALRVTECQRRVGGLAPGAGFGWGALGRGGGAACWSDVFGRPAPQDATDQPQTTLRLRRIRARNEPYFATVRPVCFLDDLTVKNILVDRGELSGIIDVDEVCYGDPVLFIGKTLAHLASDVGDVGAPYGAELLRCWGPSAEEMRALRFYCALWTSGFVRLAQQQGDLARAQALEPIAQSMLQLAEA